MTRKSSRPAPTNPHLGTSLQEAPLGVGALAVSEPQLRPWVAAAIVADTADLIATVAAGDSLPLAGRILVGAIASGGAILLAGLRPRPRSA
jgi:hypothetical protein